MIDTACTLRYAPADDLLPFPAVVLGCHEGWAKLARNPKAEGDDELIEAYRGTTSLPFEPGEHRRVAVTIVDDRGIERLEVLEMPE